MKTDQLEAPLQINIMTKIKAFVSLMKLRLSSLVVLSAFFGFFMAKGDINSLAMYSLLSGGLLITGSSNGFNQLLEIKTDTLMSRTKSRPLPVQIISKIEAIIFCIIIGALGLFLLYTINYYSSVASSVGAAKATACRSSSSRASITILSRSEATRRIC